MSTASNTRPGLSGGERDLVEEMWLSQADPVGAWLDVLMGLVRLGSAEKRAIRDELDSHLRDRVRDLMLTGLHEANATREAIAELGDAAELAARYARASKSPARRRIAMNLGLFGMAGAALVTSFVAMQQPSGTGGSDAGVTPQAGMSVYPGVPASVQERVPVGAVRVDGTPLDEVLRRVAKSVDRRLFVDWPSLGELGLGSDTPISVDVPDADLPTLFEAIRGAAEVDPQIGRLEYRVDAKELRVASGHVFDVKERILVTIDIAHVLEEDVGVDQIRELVNSFIEPDGWVDNGGEIAAMSIVGTKLFVKAPPRVIEGVRWIVGQFAAPERARMNTDGFEERRDATSPNASTDGQPDALSRVTAFLPIKNVSHENFSFALQRVMQPMRESMGTNMPGIVFNGSSMEAEVTGQLVFVERVCEAINKMDAELGARGVEIGSEDAAASVGLSAATVQVRSMPAIRMIDIVEFVIREDRRFGRGPQQPVIALASGMNAVVFRAMPDDIQALKELIAALDFMPCGVVGEASAQIVAVRSGDMPMFKRLFTHAINSKWSGSADFPEFRTLRFEDEAVQVVATDDQLLALSKLAAAIRR
ncbi:MAG: hypothetical protein KF912_09530 [Phycisphaeraceae bacterium]|nr:hypothetical protein [Phycisphaeraceae bacterium]MBX3367535.1 hypothetical protein [Phycisphaeraceae bacterium]